MTSNSAGVTTAFVDLATFDEMGAFMYGGSEAVTYFVMAVKKSNWFSQLPALLRLVNGTATFDTEFSNSINRSGDYVLNLWFHAQIPQITLVNGVHTDAAIRFCRNFMHNLVQQVTLTFNELTLATIDSTWLDYYKVYQIPEDKQVAYDNMIANIASYTDWCFPRDTFNAVNNQVALGDGAMHAVVIPFFFFMDSGVALMVAGLPFNEIKANFILRSIETLILLDQGTAGGVAATYTDLREATINPAAAAGGAVVTTGSATIRLRNAETWATYAVVHNDERVKIGKAPRDILIQQVQRASDRDLDVTALNATTTVDLRFSHQIIALFWNAALNYHPASHSEYSTVPHFGTGAFGFDNGGAINTQPTDDGVDPISQTDLVYENTTRVSQLSHYYTQIDPFFFSNRAPGANSTHTETGYHMKSYSLNTFEYQPKGSTSFSKLANVSMIHTSSTGAFYASTGSARAVQYAENAFSTGTIVVSPNNTGGVNPLVNATNATNNNMAWRLRHRALNWNIARVAGGSLGLPVL